MIGHKIWGGWAYRNPFWSINADLTYAYYRTFDPFLFFYHCICFRCLNSPQRRIEQINRRFYRYRCDLFVVMTRLCRFARQFWLLISLLHTTLQALAIKLKQSVECAQQPRSRGFSLSSLDQQPYLFCRRQYINHRAVNVCVLLTLIVKCIDKHTHNHMRVFTDRALTPNNISKRCFVFNVQRNNKLK